MLFYTIEFLIFFIILISLLFIFRGNHKKKLILLASSYIFYMWWNPVFILLIIFSTVIDFFIGKRLEKEEDDNKRKILLVMSLCGNLGMLVFFKYFGFFQMNMLFLLKMFGHDPNWTTLNIILPVGISFYTFQTLSYTIDVYRRKLKTCHSALDFSLFVSFFPQLVAGPIVRAADFLPQLKKESKLNFNRYALLMIIRGVFKKVIIADNISKFADIVFNSPHSWNSVVIWMALVCFYIQIYCDFSGYSDIAIGIADILGYKLMLNFNRPYFSRNPSDFWKRWHISLSEWLRDYLYIPLGGNRSGTWGMYRNLTITMLLGGLWHGAGWSFILWGLLHAVALIGHRLWVSFMKILKLEGLRDVAIYKLMSWAIMQYWVLLTWIPFRVQKTRDMLFCIKKFMFFDFDFQLSGKGLASSSMGMFSVLFFIFMFAILHLFSYFCGSLDKKIDNLKGLMPYVACVVIGVVFFLFWPSNESPFIYFQF